MPASCTRVCAWEAKEAKLPLLSPLFLSLERTAPHPSNDVYLGRDRQQNWFPPRGPFTCHLTKCFLPQGSALVLTWRPATTATDAIEHEPNPDRLPRYFTKAK
ncbi:hypothetical protein LZ32DRAFT_138065 [Colletotrichum eremochloae]|nr:hypothetical protein LZ32DRAFT_138065 [Colletotrichum eremochloae]